MLLEDSFKEKSAYEAEIKIIANQSEEIKNHLLTT